MRERIAVLALAVLILGGGLFPQPRVTSRYLAVERVLGHRKEDAINRDRAAPVEWAPW